MIFKKISLLTFVRHQCLSRKVHKYATIFESNDSKNVGKTYKIQGWVRAVRKMKGNIFLDVNDGTSSDSLQVVVGKDEKTKELTYGCSVLAEGEITLAPNGRAELQAEKITVIGQCSLDGYPFAPRKQYSTDYVREYLHLRPRTRTFSSTMRLRDLASNAIRDHFRNRDFISVHTPILTSNDCEGAGEVFTVLPDNKDLLHQMKREGQEDIETSYFSGKAFLSVSGQLHLEACARALSRVYSFNPTFRAENTKSRLHLSEFYMIEAEIAFVTSLKEVASEAELLIKSVTRSVIEKGGSDLKAINAPEPTWLDKDFGYTTYSEALEILDKNSDRITFPVKKGQAMAREHELFLVHYFGDAPVFVVDWPKEAKPFYMKQCDNDETKVKALDLLAPTVGELIGGSIREDDYKTLKSKIPKGINLDWYLDLRKYGNVPTAGFGMGFERYLQLISGIPNIKDVIPFPRWPHNCNF